MKLLFMMIEMSGDISFSRLLGISVILSIAYVAPLIGYNATRNIKKSRLLCVCPFMVFSVIMYYSYCLFGMDRDISFLAIFGIIYSVLSLALVNYSRKKKIMKYMDSNGIDNFDEVDESKIFNYVDYDDIDDDEDDDDIDWRMFK